NVCQDDLLALHELLKTTGGDEEIVEVYGADVWDQIAEPLFHGILPTAGGIFQPERHSQEGPQSICGDERGLFDVLQSHFYLVESLVCIEAGEDDHVQDGLGDRLDGGEGPVASFGLLI